ncbi:MAG: hypothetical protein D6694_12310 [Gammaproteobacteria bacterium]|nr:MAG: hypothetical protein D6694_12310 [Gammaproteobacteria bacterium]
MVRKMGFIRGGLLLMALFLVATLWGCANTIKAIENKDLTVNAKMSDTIFLDAETLADAMQGSKGGIFVRVANTSDFQEIDFSDLIRTKLTSMGYNVVKNPKQATYHVTANLLYLNEAKEGMNMESVLASGFGGAVLGASVAGVSGHSWRGAGTAGLAVGLAAAAVDAGAGLMWKVKEYIGVADIQIKEVVPGGVTGSQESSLANGIGTATKTTRKIVSDKQEYRTRIAVNAKQTNIDRNEACKTIAERLASQISGLFKM